MIVRQGQMDCQAVLMGSVRQGAWDCTLINRPGVAGAGLQTPSTLINSFINSVTDPLVKISSQSQTVRARKLKF